MTIRIHEYVRENGQVPFKVWFDRLDVQAAARVSTATFRLSLGNMGALKALSDGLAKLRIDWGPEAAAKPASKTARRR